jgi:hypothetical protein
MQTRLYSDLYGLIQAMLGIDFSVVESLRVKALINRRIQKAYRTSNYWTRYLKIGEQRDVVDGIVPFTQFNMPSIDTFISIYLQHPYNANGGQEFAYTLTSVGAELVADSQASGIAFVTYKAAIADYYGDNAGEEQNIPYEWFQYVANGVYADYLRAEGQQEKAAIAEQETKEILTEELIRLDEQRTQINISPRILTTSNMSCRYGYGAVIGRTISGPSGLVIIEEDGDNITTEG